MFLKTDNTTRVVSGRLVTPSYTDTSGSCIRWYMLLGSNATLRVRTYAFGSLNPTVLYTVHGEQGKQWKLAQATVRSSSPYQVVFEGLLNNTLDSIALDDVEIQSGVCGELASCDFEKDICAFQYLKADFDWRRTSYNIELLLAPQFDHTTNNRGGLIEDFIELLLCLSFFPHQDFIYGWTDDKQLPVEKLVSNRNLFQSKCDVSPFGII